LLLAYRTLAKARLFASQASSASAKNWEAFAANFEAAVVFGRSVTFHLQKELRSTPGFDTWYEAEQERMRADPVLSLFKDERNFILKQGPARLKDRKHVLVETAGTVEMAGELQVKVIRGSPWYRRSVSILWEDFKRDLLQRFKPLIPRRSPRRPAPASHPGTVATERHVHFLDHEGFRDSPALDLLQYFFDTLQVMIQTAEGRFSSSTEKSNDGA